MNNMTKAEILAIAKPILFNTQMVQAISDRHKSVTRRVIKPQPPKDFIFNTLYSDEIAEFKRIMQSDPLCDYAEFFKVKTRYKAGDILYVRETWSRVFVRPKRYLFKTNCPEAENLPLKWRPSIHMPKEAARIFLRVTDVRVERLQDITLNDVYNEGILLYKCDNCKGLGRCKNTGQKHCYEWLWNSTTPKKELALYGWNANPWVTVNEFERIEV